MPSKEHDGSSIVTLRLPDDLLERLDRYLDWMMTHRGEKSSRSQAIRQALMKWLEVEEEQGGMTHPEVLRRHFQAAYTSLRSGDPRSRFIACVTCWAGRSSDSMRWWSNFERSVKSPFTSVMPVTSVMKNGGIAMK